MNDNACSGRWGRNPDVVFRVVAGERLLVPVRGEVARTHRIYTLNPLGAAVWEILETPLAFDELCRALAKRYPGTPLDRVEGDTRRFLLELEGFGLLRRDDGKAADGL